MGFALRVGMKTLPKYLFVALLVSTVSCRGQNQKTMNKEPESYSVQKTEEQWRKQLTPQEYFVLREKGTERPYTGEYNVHFEKGTYTCKGCNAPLFTSDSKFEGHCGWPSFDKGISKGAIVEKLDKSHGMMRTEILCANCGGHLGHVFNDGPTSTGLRYCVNSLSIKFEEK
jgi:peptide-methionine (R)-S-oxide reductase